MPAVSADQVLEAAETYSAMVGLGADDTHPQWLLHVDRCFAVEMADFLTQWERQPIALRDWATSEVFIPKEAGDTIPIGLSVAPLRMWSRIMSSLGRQWEAQRAPRIRSKHVAVQTKCFFIKVIATHGCEELSLLR